MSVRNEIGDGKGTARGQQCTNIGLSVVEEILTKGRSEVNRSLQRDFMGKGGFKID